MSCDLIIPDVSLIQDLTVVDMLTVPVQDLDDSSPSSCNLSSSEDCESSTSPDTMLTKDLDQDKDSGIEFCGEDSSQPLEGLMPPEKELMQGIIDMVEYYFSDANLLKDTFLLKHVRRNKEGYVSLKLITNFRKVKTFTRDWKVVAYSLKHSKLMEVNEQCTKVRRRQALPSHDETQPSRTVLVAGLPSVDGETLELVSRFGDVVLVRLVKSTDAGAATEQHKDLKKFFARRPDLEGTPCVLVEFARQDSAARAVQELNVGSANYTAYTLNDKATVPVTQQKPQPLSNKPGKQQATNKKVRSKCVKKTIQQQQKAVDSSDSEHQYSPELRRRSSGSVSSGYFSSSPRYTDFFERRAGNRTVSLSAGSTQPATVIRPRNRLDSAPVTTSTLSAEASPWVQRRIAARSQTQTCVIVLRDPRGPDGTKGFQPRKTVLATL